MAVGAGASLPWLVVGQRREGPASHAERAWLQPSPYGRGTSDQDAAAGGRGSGGPATVAAQAPMGAGDAGQVSGGLRGLRRRWPSRSMPRPSCHLPPGSWRHGRLNGRQFVGCADASEDFPRRGRGVPVGLDGLVGGVGRARSGLALVRRASPALGRSQALVPRRQGASPVAEVVGGQALIQPGAWAGRRERSSESPEGSPGLLCWPCCGLVSGHPEVKVDLGDTGVSLQGVGGGGSGLRDQVGPPVGRELGLLLVLAAQGGGR